MRHNLRSLANKGVRYLPTHPPNHPDPRVSVNICSPGWIPSVAPGVPSMEVALSEGTPGLTPEDLRLPALPPVDEEVGVLF